MSTEDISSTGSLNRGNDRKIVKEDAQTGAITSDAIVSQEYTNLTKGDSHSSLAFRRSSTGTNRRRQARVSGHHQPQHGQVLRP